MYIVMYEAESYVDVLEGMNERARSFDTLQDALNHVQLEHEDKGLDPMDYTIWTPHKPKVTLSI